VAGPIVLASALSRLVRVTCPHCGKVKLVERRPVAYRVCSRCGRHFQNGRPKRQHVSGRSS
jgi:uncharacterized protein (DUF983 family)